jgi:NAD(P)-dependent dehydrogenase (short-subunit alcohol dehydrogenase family)
MMSKKRIQIDGRTAFVSGAGSGIGRAVAQRLSAHGCPVAIVDQDEDALSATARLLEGPVLTRRLDVRDRHAQLAFAAEVAEWAPAPLGMVFNNAGVTTSQSVEEAAVEDDEWVLDVNLGGVINGVRAFLPILRAQDSGAIVNTSSVFGLVGIPYQSAYCASKFAVRGFTDSLRQELRGTGVHAVNVHPGGVKTNIVRNARYHSYPGQPDMDHEEFSRSFESIAHTTPAKAARTIHEGVKAGKSRILVGPDAYLFDALARGMPTRYYDVLARLESLVSRRTGLPPAVSSATPPHQHGDEHHPDGDQ